MSLFAVSVSCLVVGWGRSRVFQAGNGMGDDQLLEGGRSMQDMTGLDNPDFVDVRCLLRCVVLRCVALLCFAFVWSCLVFSCLVLSCLVLSSLVLS